MAGWREWVKGMLLRRGIVLSRPPGQFLIGDIKLRSMRERGLKLDMAIDGGAAEGAWARLFKQVYPEAQVLCVEPRDDVQEKLAAVARELGGIQIAKTLIGEKPGEVEFFRHAEQSSMLPVSGGAVGGGGGAIPVRERVDTIDNLVAALKLPPPDFIKLDLQGAELAALRGATAALRSVQALVVEVSFIPIYQGAPLVAEVVASMAGWGFRLYDICGLWHRPLDGALAQGDFLFVREGHPLLADSRWSADGSMSSEG
jgi:FkbM family methyltransferase